MDAREQMVIHWMHSLQSQLCLARSEYMIVPFDAIEMFRSSMQPYYRHNNPHYNPAVLIGLIARS
jgi:hypothetical protein